MGLFSWLFREKANPGVAVSSSGGSSRQTRASSQSREEYSVSADAVGPTISQLASRSIKEGWNAFASILVRCSACAANYRLSRSPVGTLELVGETGACFDLDKPFRCRQCQAEILTVINSKKPMRLWLSQLCGNLEASKDDPNRGFEDIERGGRITDHAFEMAGGFDRLWSLIGEGLDPADGVNPKAIFDLIWSRSLGEWRKVRRTVSIIHFNQATRKSVEIIKDNNGNFWFMIGGRGA